VTTTGGWGFALGTTVRREEAWAQYHLKFEEGFDANDQDHADRDTDDGKLPGWRGPDRCGSDTPCDGTNGWRAWGSFHDPARWGGPSHVDGGPIQLCYYVYHAEDHGQYGDTEPWLENDAGIVEPGEWHELTLYARMNDADEADGVLAAWVDGQRAYRRSDWLFRTAGGADIDVRSWWHISHFGGGWYPPTDQSIYTDDLRIYAENPL